MVKLKYKSPQAVAIIVLSALLIIAVSLAVLAFISPSKARPVSNAKPRSTAVVESGKIGETIVTSGNLQPTGIVNLPLPNIGEVSVITKTNTNTGKNVNYCKPIIEISGRPIFAFTGEFPAYRDINVGDTGPDVKQLQLALRDCGIKTSVTGKADRRLLRIVTNLYKKAGYKIVKTENSTTNPGKTEANHNKPAAYQNQTTSTIIPATWKMNGQPVITPSENPDNSDNPVADNQPQPKEEPGTQPNPAPAPSSGNGEKAQPEPELILPRTEILIVPKNAIVHTLPKVGEIIGEETKIVLGTGKLQIKVTVNTGTFLHLKAGQPVKMSSGQWEENSSIPELPTQPDPVDKKEGNTEANYTFILPAQNPPNVGPEIPIQCEVQLGDQTVYPKVVPVSAVHYEGDQTVVYVVDKKQPEKVRREKVKVIVSGDTAAAIEANIPVGTEVYTDEQS